MIEDKMLLKHLLGQSSGTFPSVRLKRGEKTRRIDSLQLSQHDHLESVHKTGINSLDIDPIEGRYLLSGSSKGTIAIHDTWVTPSANGTVCPAVVKIEPGRRGAHKMSVETVQWYTHDTGIFLTSSVDNSLRVWDTNEAITTEIFKFAGKIYSHHLSTSKKHCLIAAGNEDSRVYLCDMNTGSKTHILKGHSAAVLSVAWSPRNSFILASGSLDNQVIFHDVRKASSILFRLDQHNGQKFNKQKHVVITAHNGHVNSLSFTSDGLHLMTFGSDDSLRLWDTYTGRNTLVNYGLVPNLSHRGIQFAISSDTDNDLAFVPTASSVGVFEVYTGSRRADLLGHFNHVNCCVYQRQYQQLFSGSNDSNILAWIPEDDQLKHNASVEEETTAKKPAAFEDAWSSDED